MLHCTGVALLTGIYSGHFETEHGATGRRAGQRSLDVLRGVDGCLVDD